MITNNSKNIGELTLNELVLTAENDPIIQEISGTFLEKHDFEQISANFLTAETEPQLSALSNDFLNKKTGGDISGNIGVLSGNYIQTTDEVDMYGGKNAFIQADTNRASYGKSSVGSKGFYVLSVIGTNKLKLSGSINIPSTAYSKTWSVSLADKLNSQFSQISSVDGQIVTFKSQFDSTIQAQSISSESQLTALIADDDNAFYCPSDATIGNVVLNFYGQHAEGGSVHAIAQYSHAEGRGSIAEGRYAHAEGNITTAGGAGAHAEGMYAKALGNRSHAEGERTFAYGIGAHAEGYQTSAESNYAHSEGEWTYAKAEASHAEGVATKATGRSSHAEGYAVSAIGNYSHAGGISSIANANDSYANGVQVSAMNYRTIALGYKASTTQQGQFVWNGYTSEQKPYTPSNTMQGSFNINPTNGISGFYIGQMNFISCVAKALESAKNNSTLSTMMKNAIQAYLI